MRRGSDKWYKVVFGVHINPTNHGRGKQSVLEFMFIHSPPPEYQTNVAPLKFYNLFNKNWYYYEIWKTKSML